MLDFLTGGIKIQHDFFDSFTCVNTERDGCLWTSSKTGGIFQHGKVSDCDTSWWHRFSGYQCGRYEGY